MNTYTIIALALPLSTTSLLTKEVVSKHVPPTPAPTPTPTSTPTPTPTQTTPTPTSTSTPTPKGPVTDRSCDGTVAYAFLTRDGLPLWEVWKTYFAGCPKGSATVLVHSQRKYGGNASVVHEVGGKVLPSSETILEHLRFSYAMVEATLKLYGGVKSGGVAPNGCTPRWVHLASESCAPIVPCSQVHAMLSKNAGSSFVEQGEQGNGVIKSSQWMTLWGEHAFDLWNDRDKLRNKWMDLQKRLWTIAIAGGYQGSVDEFIYHGAYDEYVFPNELKERGLRIQASVLTYVHFARDHESHPEKYSKKEEVRHATSAGDLKQHRFARKFSASPDAIALLLMLVDANKQWATRNILPTIHKKLEQYMLH